MFLLYVMLLDDNLSLPFPGASACSGIIYNTLHMAAQDVSMRTLARLPLFFNACIYIYIYIYIYMCIVAFKKLR